MLKIFHTKNQKKWNHFLFKNQGLILQSFEWGKIQDNNLKLAVLKNKKRIAQGLFIEKKLPLGKKYYYCPWINNLDFQILKLFIQDIKKDKNCLFIRFEPQNFFEERKIYCKFQNIKKTLNLQPQNVWILNLEKTENDLLQQMKSKTRYNIRLAKKKRLTTHCGTSQKKLETFLELLKKTSKRHKFKIHPKNHYEKIIKNLGSKKMARIFIIYYKKTPLAASIITFFNNEAYYMHGASSDEHKNLMAPYLMHWQAILYAKKVGCKIYNFGGIDQKGWEGISKFKKSFGGKKITYSQAFDVIVDKKWYNIYQISKKLFKPQSS